MIHERNGFLNLVAGRRWRRSSCFEKKIWKSKSMFLLKYICVYSVYFQDQEELIFHENLMCRAKSIVWKYKVPLRRKVIKNCNILSLELSFLSRQLDFRIWKWKCQLNIGNFLKVYNEDLKVVKQLYWNQTVGIGVLL